ncbi:MAG: hypothetical protein WBQ18_17125, partial [Solirubrobacteraceae bacterium]
MTALAPTDPVYRCGGCGRVGSLHSTNGHRGRSPNPRCRLAEPQMLTDDEVAAAVARPGRSGQVPAELEVPSLDDEEQAAEPDDDADLPAPPPPPPQSTAHRVT